MKVLKTIKSVYDDQHFNKRPTGIQILISHLLEIWQAYL